MLLIPVNNCRGSELEKASCAIYQKISFVRKKFFDVKFLSPRKQCDSFCQQVFPDEFVNLISYLPIDNIWERNAISLKAHQKTFVWRF